MELNAGAIEWLTERVRDGIAREATLNPLALLFLLRRYNATGRDDLCEALEPALDRTIAEFPRLECSDERAAWLTVFAEATTVSDSAGLRESAERLVSRLRREWPAATVVGDSMRSIAACLAAVNVGDPRALVPDAVDELERIVAGAYEPGEGMTHTIGAPFVPGELGDQIWTAGALLTAYALTDRLPYSMLAEELVRCAQRTRSDAGSGGFVGSFADNCDAAIVLGRLTALHRDAAYREAAVVAPDADYAADAERTLRAQAATVAERGLEAARFGLALDELLRLR